MQRWQNYLSESRRHSSCVCVKLFGQSVASVPGCYACSTRSSDYSRKMTKRIKQRYYIRFYKKVWWYTISKQPEDSADLWWWCHGQDADQRGKEPLQTLPHLCGMWGMKREIDWEVFENRHKKPLRKIKEIAHKCGLNTESASSI